MSPDAEPVVALEARVREVAGSHNLRDLGGLVNVRGQRLRTGRVFRSDYPGFVEADAQTAAFLRLAAVVDLRRAAEVEIECVDWEDRGISYHRWPLTAGHEDSWHARYTSYLTRRPETVVGAVRAVMRPDNHAVLFHCAAGKDRTGVVAALLLALLGVAEDEIVEDYLLSASSVDAIVTRLLAHQTYAEMLVDSSVDAQLPREENIRPLLRWLVDQGGAEAWLTGNGVPTAEIAAFRAALLEG